MHVTTPISQQVVAASTQVSAQLPPSSRDFQVYRLVTIEQRSTRAAGQELNLSQTRVCQIVSRVAEFLLANTPGADDEEQQRKRLRLAEQIAAERIDHLQRQAMEGFQRSLAAGEKDKSKAGGDPRFLYLAGRLAMLGARLPVARLEMLAYTASGEEEAAPECESNPPSGACSLVPPVEEHRSVAKSPPRATKPLPPESSVAGVSVGLLAKLAQNGAVQTATAGKSMACERDSKRERRAAFFAGS